MKGSLLWIALPATALVAPSTFAVQYLTLAQAQQAIFPGHSFIAAPVHLTNEQKKAIEKQSDARVLKDDEPVWRVSGGGWFIVDEVVGKHEFITYAVGLTSKGSVKQIEIMEYRETYGGQVRDPRWRAQFDGKTSATPPKLGDNIKNISGATLSSRHITDGMRRLLAFYDVALKCGGRAHCSAPLSM